MYVEYIDWNDKFRKEVLTKRNIMEGDFNSKDYINLTLSSVCCIFEVIILFPADFISHCMTKVGGGNYAC